jgi:hypothetical protein
MRLMIMSEQALASVPGPGRANCRGKPVAAAKFGAYEVAIVAESPAERRNLYLQIILSDDDAWPDATEKIAFGHQRAIGIQQRQKQIERSCSQLDGDAIGEQLPPSQ